MPQLSTRGFELDYAVDGPPTQNTTAQSTPLIWGHGLTASRGISAAFPLIDVTRHRATRSVVRYDARGHGLSSQLEDPTKGSWAELALDQISLIDHLGYSSVVIGGVSMGAGTALYSALELGERVEKMVLVIPPTGWAARAPQIDVYEQTARVAEAKGPRALLAAAAELPPPDPFTDGTEWQDRRVGSLGGADPVRLAKCLRGAAYADLPPLDQIATITTPTLVLAWSGDPGHPVATAEALRDTLPNVDVSIASTRAEFDSWSDQLESFLS